jgi:hypothetical protein
MANQSETMEHHIILKGAWVVLPEPIESDLKT